MDKTPCIRMMLGVLFDPKYIMQCSIHVKIMCSNFTITFTLNQYNIVSDTENVYLFHSFFNLNAVNISTN